MSRWSSSSSSPWTLPPALPEGQGTPHRQNVNNRGKNHPDALAELGRRADRAHHLSADIFFLPQSPVSTTLTAPAASRHALPTRHHFFAIHISPACTRLPEWGDLKNRQSPAPYNLDYAFLPQDGSLLSNLPAWLSRLRTSKGLSLPGLPWNSVHSNLSFFNKINLLRESLQPPYHRYVSMIVAIAFVVYSHN